jgi:glyoxylase-like metal-dependent hydrolase (beta-lactamase superfamily II)
MMSSGKVKLYVMKIGRVNLPDKSHMTPGIGQGEPISMPGYCYLIDHPNGLALVDTGMEHDGPAVVADGEYVTMQLSALGHQPDDIKYVIMTHLHVDHAGFMTSFPNATFIVRQAELKAAWWPERCEHGYFYHLYRDTRDYDYLQPGDDELFDVFCDGSVQLIDTKGHTRGHQSVVVNLENEGKVVLVADAASLRENLDDDILPGTCSNNWFAMRSLEKLRHLETEGYKLFFGHDLDQEKELKLVPEYYD